MTKWTKKGIKMGKGCLAKIKNKEQSKMSEAPKLETERLILTWPTQTQIDQYYSDIIGTSLFDTIIWDGPENKNELHDYWKECSSIDPKDFSESLGFAIIEKESSLYVGGCSLRPVDRDPSVIDVGIALAPKFHNNGYGTEALKKIIDEAFQKREAVRIFGSVFSGNIPSRRMFEKLGFVLEGTLRSSVKKRGNWLDEWIFGKLVSEHLEEKI